MYAVVEFIEGKNIELVPNSWLTDDDSMCLWPPQRKIGEISNFIKKCKAPQDGWKKYAVKVLGKADSFAEGRKKLKKAVDNSDINSITEDEDLGRGRRQKRMPQWYSEDEDTMSEENEESVSNIMKNLPSPKESYINTGPKTPSLNPEKSPQSSHSAEENSGKKVEKQMLSLLLNIKFKLADMQENLLEIMKRIEKLEERNHNITGEAEDMDTGIVLPVLPLNTTEELQCLEESLISDSALKKALILKLQKIGGVTLSSIVVRLMTAIITNSLAMEFSLYGAKKKRSFSSLCLFDVITEVVRKHILNATNEDISRPLSTWLRHAKERKNKKKSSE